MLGFQPKPYVDRSQPWNSQIDIDSIRLITTRVFKFSFSHYLCDSSDACVIIYQKKMNRSIMNSDLN